jgi:hypothetical protein|uniref:Transmembrane protein n=1 Tax=Bionectria ochroleuca TaxID=29856 RepID=A0A8H7N5I4_BIOOC
MGGSRFTVAPAGSRLPISPEWQARPPHLTCAFCICISFFSEGPSRRWSTLPATWFMRIVILCHLHSRFFYQLAPAIALPACLTLFSLLLFFFFCSGMPPQLPLILHYFFSSSRSFLRSFPFSFSTSHRENLSLSFLFL